MSDDTVNLNERVGDTLVTNGELLALGHTFMNLLGAVDLMRHASPSGTADYAGGDSWVQMIVSDAFLWAKSTPEARDRVQAFLTNSGWRDHMLADRQVSA